MRFGISDDLDCSRCHLGRDEALEECQAGCMKERTDCYHRTKRRQQQEDNTDGAYDTGREVTAGERTPLSIGLEDSW